LGQEKPTFVAYSTIMMLSVFLTLLSPGHIVLIVAAVLLLFGGKKIPELMKGIGQGIREFKDAKDAKKDDQLPENKN
jgi:sec-independent protein translocase protein TatA